ncbi:MAG: hypothetical protein H7831_06550 [Magnetococcus sp. WYHC-3]
MNFKDLLQLTEASRATRDSFRTTGEAMEKEKIKSSSADDKAKDAARKRAERAREIPRSRKSKEELVKEIIAVKTKSGKIQLIFKDSFNKNNHELISKGKEISMGEANALAKEENFEQTGASKLLFGNIRQKEKSEENKGSKGKSTEELRKEKEQKFEDEEKEAKPAEEKKAKKLSKEEIFQLMTQMTPEQLIQMPIDVRQEYFKRLRNPPANSDFDDMTFEKLSTKFGINQLSTASYNQQVLNALVFLAKIKAGASEQELDSFISLSPNALEFTKKAYEQAKKILSQIGDQCIQNLVTSIENGTKTTFEEGNVDMECGNYKFKISSGGEFSLTTDKFDQNSKGFRGMIAGAIMQALNSPSISQDPKVSKFVDTVQKNGSGFSQYLISRSAFAQIQNDPEMMAQLKATQLTNDSGQNLGPVLDENGNLNKFASLENYQKEITKATPTLFKNSSKKSSEFSDVFVKSILKTFYRGDNIKNPEFSPTHLVTQNGIFPMTDAYFDEIAKNATISVKPSTDLINAGNVENKNNASSELLRKFSSVVEQTEPKEKVTLQSLLIPKNSINPVELALDYVSKNMDFDISVSLLPGFSPKDLNTIQYNYVRVGGKTVKIPVEKTGSLKETMGESFSLFLNDLLIESLSNNFVLDTLIKAKLLDSQEVAFLNSENILLESTNGLKIAFNNAYQRAVKNPDLLLYVMNKVNSHMYEEYKRDYKMEYRNYHGKPKQRKQRAKRTAARERLIRQGKVKKGSRKDVDHKRPLRNGGSNGINNLRLRDKSDNRSDNGHKKGEKQNKDWK